MMASEFSLGEFFRDPSAERLSSLTKVELLEVTTHYEVVNIKRYMLKSDILNKIVEFLVAKEVLSSEMAKSMSVTPPRSRSPELNSQARSSASDEVRIKELELERARVELEREKLVAVNRKESRNTDRHFDVAKHVRMVPPFEEEGVEKYFPHFEKLAQSMGWPREMWAHLIQSKFNGKARDAYLAMSMADVSDYDKVKSSVLKAYELVPEAYRQRFRKARKEESQTRVFKTKRAIF